MFPEGMPWYKSRIIVGALVSILMKILVATGLLQEVGIDSEALTDAALLVIGGAADMYILYARTTQKEAPAIVAK